MTVAGIRPIEGDPASDQIMRMFDLGNDEWLLAAPGDYQTAAVETFKRDGSGYQRVIALEWPGRVNHSDEVRIVRLMVSADDALGLADVLTHTAKWLRSIE